MSDKTQLTRLRNSLHRGAGVLTPDDVENKLRKIRLIEASVAYRDHMSQFDSIEDYRTFIAERPLLKGAV